MKSSPGRNEYATKKNETNGTRRGAQIKETADRETMSGLQRQRQRQRWRMRASGIGGCQDRLDPESQGAGAGVQDAANDMQATTLQRFSSAAAQQRRCLKGWAVQSYV